jgi:hypothetical protein
MPQRIVRRPRRPKVKAWSLSNRGRGAALGLVAALGPRLGQAEPAATQQDGDSPTVAERSATAVGTVQADQAPSGSPPVDTSAGATEVVVHGAGRAPGAVTITREEARALPGAFGDPVRAMEALPGVTPTVSGVPYFFVRGAPPANVGFFVDGVDVPMLYHAYIGPSVLHPALLESVTLYSGAPPVRYGRNAGAAVVASTRGPRDEWNGEASVRAIDAGGLVEAPFGSARGSALVGGRYSYAGPILSLLSNTELKYWDYQAMVTYRTGAHDSVTVLGFGAQDSLRSGSSDLQAQLGGDAQFHRMDLRWDAQPSPRTRTRLGVTLGLDQTGENTTNTWATDRSLRVRSEIRHQLSRGVALELGGDARVDDYGLRIGPSRANPGDVRTLFPARTEHTAGAYLGLEIRPVRAITLMPGVRADLFTSPGAAAVGVDPRVLAAFQLSRNVTLEETLGLSHQRPNFVPQVPAAQVSGLGGGLQSAVNWSSGLRCKLPEEITASATVFRSVYFDAVDPIGGARDFTLDPATLQQRWTISSYGLELLLRRSLTRRLGGFIGYTLSRSEHHRGTVASVTGYDRPHVLQAALGYDLGAGTRVGLRFVGYSGVPALMVGADPPRFSERIRGPAFFRIDARIEKRWPLGERGYWGLVGEVLNATATKEVLRVECGGVCQADRVGPVVLPSVGAEVGY